MEVSARIVVYENTAKIFKYNEVFANSKNELDLAVEEAIDMMCDAVWDATWGVYPADKFSAGESIDHFKKFVFSHQNVIA